MSDKVEKLLEAIEGRVEKLDEGEVLLVREIVEIASEDPSVRALLLEAIDEPARVAPEPAPTLDEFRLTRRYSTPGEILEATTFESEEPGWLYAARAGEPHLYVIHDIGGGEGRLVLGNCEYESDLDELEERLFHDFVIEEWLGSRGRES